MGTDFRKEIGATVDQRSSEYTKISDAIWGFAEPRFQEYESSRVQQEFLDVSADFPSGRTLRGRETAFIAEWGSGKPVLAFLGEFDALSSLQQEADCTERLRSREKQMDMAAATIFSERPLWRLSMR